MCDRALQPHDLNGHGRGYRGLRCDRGYARACLQDENARGNVHARVRGCARVSVRGCGPHPRAGAHGCVNGCARENAGACVHVFLPY